MTGRRFMASEIRHEATPRYTAPANSDEFLTRATSLCSVHLVPRRVMLFALKREELVNRRHRDRVVAPDAHFPSPRPIDRLIADRRAPRAHHRRAGHGLRVYRKRLGEVAGAERGRDVVHVR